MVNCYPITAQEINLKTSIKNLIQMNMPGESTRWKEFKTGMQLGQSLDPLRLMVAVAGVKLTFLTCLQETAYKTSFLIGRGINNGNCESVKHETLLKGTRNSWEESSDALEIPSKTRPWEQWNSFGMLWLKQPGCTESLSRVLWRATQC